MQRYSYFLVVILLALSSGLACNRGSLSEAARMRSEAVSPESPGEYERALRDLVERQVEAEEERLSEQDIELLYRKPYWYKEYVRYPEDLSDMEVEFQQTESKSAPYIADAEIPKVRFSTRLHRSRDAARQDGNFIRHTGTETQTYELRNGRWRRLGSMFIAKQTAERINGEWVPLREEVELVPEAEEERQGFFNRVWGFITGR